MQYQIFESEMCTFCELLFPRISEIRNLETEADLSNLTLHQIEYSRYVL